MAAVGENDRTGEECRLPSKVPGEAEENHAGNAPVAARHGAASRAMAPEQNDN
jgi:hypothetical protein